ncbi:MAG: hypothetical protein IJ757_01395 [Clostridiales bacterium]|nr:hypothetical protein [Clostridiales bacterium]
MNINNLRSGLCSRYDFICELINSIEQQISRLPEGKLRIQKQAKKVYYFNVQDGSRGNGVLIRPEDKRLAKSLAQKTYLKKLLNVARYEQQHLKRFLDYYPKHTVEDVYYLQSKERQYLIKPIALSDDDYKEQWLNQPYKPKGFKEGLPVYLTNKGLRVRSKSEQIIAERLDINNIPYKYECPLVIGDVVFHPDFKILRMRDRKEIYYEHLGMMDDPDYARNNVFKLNTYALNGILPGDNLFTTMETRSAPLDTRILDRLIETQFK